MFINSLSVRNILSFGNETQELGPFLGMNLFIGKNGTGKSNALRLIGGLSCNYNKVEGTVSVRTGQFSRTLPVFTVKLDDQFVCNRLPYGSWVGDLTINYATRGGSGVNEERLLRFRNSELVHGDIGDFKRHSVNMIESDWSDAVFVSSFADDHDPWQREAVLVFGLRYIFQRQFSVLGRGMLSEAHTRQEEKFVGGGGVVRFDKDAWPDGILRTAKILKQISGSGGVVLLEEPELGLEPRAVRRLFDFLCWVSTPEDHMNDASAAVTKINGEWNEYVAEIQDAREEPVSMPKRLIRQFFITSHSATLLSKFLENRQSTTIHEFSLQWKPNGFDPNDKANSGSRSWTQQAEKRGWMEQDTLFSQVRRVNSQPYTVLNELGASGADLLQCNGVVWVEGPSDVIYISKWLDMYAEENGLDKLRQGRDFEFQMYGGALLTSLCLQSEANDPSEERKKLVEMFSFSRNAYVVMDSDAVKDDKGETFDISTFADAKRFVKAQIEKLNSERHLLGLWFAEGDFELRTIEDYLDEKSIEAVPKSIRENQKKLAAERRVAHWCEKSLQDFPAVVPEINKMFDCIKSWQK